MGDGRALQAGTSHNLGQNFAKAFDITFQARDKTVQHVWGTSWGVTTRLVGGVIMTHGDDSGLVLPPRDRAVSGRDRARSAATTGARPCCRARRRFRRELRRAGIRVTLDERDERPGWKFAEWELRGVPLRARDRPEGHREIAGADRAARHARESRACRWTACRTRLRGLLDDVQRTLLDARACSSATSTRSASATYDDVQAGRWKAGPGSSSRHGAGRPSARRRSRPTRRRRFATCRSGSTAPSGNVRPLRANRRSPRRGSRRRLNPRLIASG